jgi:hypothetical protein
VCLLRIYGFSDDDLDRIRSDVEEDLKITFRERDRSETGFYYIFDSPKGRIVLYRNSDGEERLRDEFAEWPILLNVESFEELDLAGVCGAVLLATREC